ncbi:hypothetical protein J1614_008296 [Plenodomus biglobosus]|nr:hypothetical protein J1614_008296 [Plenodomus biglobosus]
MPQPPARAFSQKDLPPSVEAAYYRKCIDLRRRITDIEDSNDGTRLRITRLNRGIQKMRLERAFLLEQINKHMEYNADDSDRSSSPPPTPTDKPLRSKRSGGGGGGGGSGAGARKATPPVQTNQIAGLGSVTQSQTQNQSPGSATTTTQHQPQQQQQQQSQQQVANSSIHPPSSAQSTPDPSRQPTSYFNAAAPSPNAAVNGATVLPPLHSLPALQTTTPRPYFDPAYDEQRAAPSTADEADAAPRHAYSSATQPPSATTADAAATATATAAATQNGDTEMTDVGFTAVNR